MELRARSVGPVHGLAITRGRLPTAVWIRPGAPARGRCFHALVQRLEPLNVVLGGLAVCAQRLRRWLIAPGFLSPRECAHAGTGSVPSRPRAARAAW
jgi:hypothetical protein